MIWDEFNLSDKTVLITGAAGGIGKELARTFARTQATLVLTDIGGREEYRKLEEYAEELEEQYTVKVICIPMDITVGEDITRMVSKLKDMEVEIDILINNAGINFYADAVDITEEVWDKVVDTNLKGTFFVTKELANYSILKRSGKIICMASQHGVVGNTKRVSYCASKAGIINMVRALSYEWAKYNVNINVISPTFVMHEANEELMYEKSFKREALMKIPLKKYATPLDIAYAALFLASKMSDMITGHNLVVDGGWTAH